MVRCVDICLHLYNWVQVHNHNILSSITANMPGGIQPPVEQWLKWPLPNYENPPERAHHVLICACVLGPISIAILFARLWVRIRLQRNAGLDDWLMLAAFVRTYPTPHTHMAKIVSLQWLP
jgi:hypothetical protein